MRRSIIGGSLAVVAATLVGVGCSDQGVKEDAKRAADTVAEEAEELGSAAREGAAPQTGASQATLASAASIITLDSTP